MNSPRRLSLSAAALVVFVATAATATAKPYTALLTPLTADLKQRLVVLKPQFDEVALIKKGLVKAALADMKDVSKSVADDLKILKDVARKIELAYGANDPQLIAALDAFVARVKADRDAAVAKMPTVVKAQSEADARDLLDAATAAIARVEQRPAELDTVKLRADVLRGAAKSVASATAKIKSGSACDKRAYGSLRMKLDDVSERPTFGNAAFTYVQGTGAVESVVLQGYYYDRKAQDQYERGAYRIHIYGVAFHGIGTYTIGQGLDISRTEHGTTWIGDVGTVEVTSYDPAKRKIAGTFSATLRNVSTSATAEVTSGYFTFCAWDEATISPKR